MGVRVFVRVRALHVCVCVCVCIRVHVRAHRLDCMRHDTLAPRRMRVQQQLSK